MHRSHKAIAAALYVLVGFPAATAAVLAVAGVILYHSADFMQPACIAEARGYELSADTDSLKICGNSCMHLNKYGLWEARISGNPSERGSKYGMMCRELLKSQEDAFVRQIHQIVHSEPWVDFLHRLVIIFNRRMARHIPLEYREEIAAMSKFCTDEYDSYGSPYVRQLNYHAAHDIGHAMQEYMLVGCSSFACWGDYGGLTVGRNFDFYAGDDFARNKLVLFIEPDDGYRFASISWPGMMGVVSGMNEKGLTVTINAAKGRLPLSSAMPVSLLARHILQYASDISEAFQIAGQFEIFVSESLLVGSSADRRAAVIEKTPGTTVLSGSCGSRIICTNHYRSEQLASEHSNLDNMATSDSPYRYSRLEELLDRYSRVCVSDAVQILRDRYGLGDSDIGLGNEKSLNQFIAHHSVVFRPDELRFWVSTSPWQSGEYVCYDLNGVFRSGLPTDKSFADGDSNIPADSVALSNDYINLCRSRELQKMFSEAASEGGRYIGPEFKEEFIKCNPNYYQVYNTLGDYELSRKNYRKAVSLWQHSLSLEIPRTNERDDIIRKIGKHDQRH